MIFLLSTNILSSLCSGKCFFSSKERFRAGGDQLRLDLMSQFGCCAPQRCRWPIWVKLSKEVVAGQADAKRWWPAQLLVLTLSALHRRPQHKIALYVPLAFFYSSSVSLKSLKLCLPSWWPQSLEWLEPQRAGLLAILADPSAPIWPVAIIICPHPSFSHSTILKYFAWLSRIWVGTTLLQICIGSVKCDYKCPPPNKSY